MTKLKLNDLSKGFGPGLMPSIFNMPFKEDALEGNEIYTVLETSYRTKEPFEIERSLEDGSIESVPYRVRSREVSNGFITFLVEDAEYPLPTSSNAP